MQSRWKNSKFLLKIYHLIFIDFTSKIHLQIHQQNQINLRWIPGFILTIHHHRTCFSNKLMQLKQKINNDKKRVGLKLDSCLNPQRESCLCGPFHNSCPSSSSTRGNGPVCISVKWNGSRNIINLIKFLVWYSVCIEHLSSRKRNTLPVSPVFKFYSSAYYTVSTFNHRHIVADFCVFWQHSGIT